MEDGEAFALFVTKRKTDLRRIARHTRGEYEVADVINEAFVVAWEISARRGSSFDCSNPLDQEMLLAHLYQRMVRYTETNVRHAVRLDHAVDENADEGSGHPLMHTLASDGGRDPLAVIIERTDLSGGVPALGHCLASAYVRLLRHFDHRMRSVADHLLISVPHAYRCCARARVLATNQTPVPALTMAMRFIPGPWRRFRLMQAPVQLAFDFKEQLTLSMIVERGPTDRSATWEPQATHHL